MSTSFLAMLFFTTLVISMSTSIAIAPQIISQLCSRTINPRYCLGFLKSISGVAAAVDMKGVDGIVLTIVQSKASQTKKVLTALSAKASNPALKERYDSCFENYNQLIINIVGAQKALAVNDFVNVSKLTVDANDGVEDCEDAYEDPLPDPSDVPLRNRNLKDTMSIAYQASNML